MFLRLKPEASGHPDQVRNLEDEERFIKTFYARKIVRLDTDSVRPNEAKRGMAKLCTNSIWGKRTERENRIQSKLIWDPYEHYRLLATPVIEFVNLLFASYTVVWASWKYTAEENVPKLRHTNEVVGACVICAGRMKLYTCLDRLGERALYCDKDNVEEL